jgi:Tfp pilus assembly protein FimV
MKAYTMSKSPAYAVRAGGLSKKPGTVWTCVKGAALICVTVVVLAWFGTPQPPSPSCFQQSRSSACEHLAAASEECVVSGDSRDSRADGYETYVVKAGDSLWSVGQRLRPHEDPRRVVRLLRSCNGLVSDRIFPGQELALPSDNRGSFDGEG